MKKAWVIVGLLGIAQSAHAIRYDVEISCHPETRSLNKFGDLYVAAQQYLDAIRTINYFKQESVHDVRNYFANGSKIHAARLEVQKKEHFLKQSKKCISLTHFSTHF